MATYSDGTTQDVTTQATWASSNPSVATVGAHTGLVLPQATSGSTNVTATFDGVVGGPVAVTTEGGTTLSVTVTPATASLAPGGTQQLIATAADSAGDNCDVTYSPFTTWQTSAQAVATVSTTGLVTATGPGSATIQATNENQSGTASVTVP